MGVSFVPMSEWFTLLAQVDPPENLPQRLLTDFTIQKILRAVLAIAIAYGTMALIQGTINWLSERVPRRLRLLIKQSIPSGKA